MLEEGERMYPFEVEGLDHDYTFLYDFQPSDFYWTSPSTSASAAKTPNRDVCTEKGMKRGREQKRSCQSESKACREKLRREKMSKRFSELCSFLHPETPVKIDKSAILDDAISALNKLQSEVQVLKEKKRKVQADIRNLKEEKNELRGEKVQLKARKDNMELKIKAIQEPAVYQEGGNKLMVLSGYGGFPMWQWISPAVLDTSQDHVLRPPVA